MAVFMVFKMSIKDQGPTLCSETLFMSHIVILASFFIVSELHAKKKFLQSITIPFLQPIYFLEERWYIKKCVHKPIINTTIKTKMCRNQQHMKRRKIGHFHLPQNHQILSLNSIDPCLYESLVIKVLFGVDTLFLILICPLSPNAFSMETYSKSSCSFLIKSSFCKRGILGSSPLENGNSWAFLSTIPGIEFGLLLFIEKKLIKKDMEKVRQRDLCWGGELTAYLQIKWKWKHYSEIDYFYFGLSFWFGIFPWTCKNELRNFNCLLVPISINLK